MPAKGIFDTWFTRATGVKAPFIQGGKIYTEVQLKETDRFTNTVYL